MTLPDLTPREVEIIIKALSASWFPSDDEQIAFELRNKLKKLLDAKPKLD